MLNASDLAYMRESIAQLLPDTCSILTVTNTPDGFGGQTQTFGTTTSACRLDVISGMEQVIGGALQPYVRTMLSLPYDATITEANRVIHGGVTYAVTTPPNSDQSWIAVKRVTLERI
jgi:hypothetical protein